VRPADLAVRRQSKFDHFFSFARVQSNRTVSTPALRRKDRNLVGQRLHFDRPVAQRHLALSSHHASVCFIQLASSRSGKSSCACAPRFRGGLRRRHGVMALPIRSAIPAPPPDRCSRSSSGRPPTCRPARPHSVHLFNALGQAFAVANTARAPAWCAAYRAADRPPWCRRWRGGCGPAGRATPRRLSRQRGWPAPGFRISAARLAAARPNTTMSSSELQPRRLAPCTDTQAHSPTASAGTIASGSLAVGAQHFGAQVGGNAAHIVMHVGRPGSAPW